MNQKVSEGLGNRKYLLSGGVVIALGSTDGVQLTTVHIIQKQDEIYLWYAINFGSKLITWIGRERRGWGLGSLAPPQSESGTFA